MTGNQNLGGFAGDPSAALSVAGSTGCCGNPAQTTNIALPDATDPAAASCCGTPAASEAATAASASAATPAAGTGCCG